MKSIKRLGVAVLNWILQGFVYASEGPVRYITAMQFGGTRIAYDKARGTGFLTKWPSKAAREIIRRIEHSPESLADYRI